jgi:hypothetical protein
MRVAADLGVEVHNMRDGELRPMHWLSFEVCDNKGALSIMARAEHVLQALSPWRTSASTVPHVDGAITSCEKHGRALVCPSCRAAIAGAKGGATMSPKRLKQLQKASKRPRPGARTENRPAKEV